MKSRVVSFSLLVITLACMKDKGGSAVYQIPAALAPYVDSFFAEALKRGHDLPKNNLVMQFNARADGALCGSCNSTTNDPGIQKIISIYQDNPCWFNTQELETLIFHELGHCILGRSHTSDTLPNGDPKSIMVPDRLSLYSPCIYPIGNPNCDQSFKRDYYLAELFDPQTPAPAWAR